jgi:undecaprenyl-diphosphatase
MTSFEAVILGIVQGVTEFLPVSSTAHLRVVPALAGWPDPGAAFTAVIQLGSLAAVVGYFLKDLAVMSGAALRAIGDRLNPPGGTARPAEPAALQLLYIIVGTIPLGLAGILLKHKVEGEFRALWVIATAQIVVGIALAVVEKRASHKRGVEDITMRDAVIIGVAQALALVPGVSRSGITLLAAMAVGLQRPAAARFSFLLSVPAVAAAGIFELKDVLNSHDVGGVPLALGLVAAVISSYASIAWLLKFLRTRTTLPFVVYRVALGVLIFALLAAGRL